MTEEEKIFQLLLVTEEQQAKLDVVMQRFDDNSKNLSEDVAKLVKRETEDAVRDLRLAAQDIYRASRRIRLGWLCFSLVAGVGLFLMLFFGAKFLWERQWDAQMDEYVHLQLQTETQQETLAKLNKKTFGIRLEQDKNGQRWIYLPHNWDVDNPNNWMWGDRNGVALKLYEEN
jgi:hypothetical protein